MLGRVGRFKLEGSAPVFDKDQSFYVFNSVKEALNKLLHLCFATVKTTHTSYSLKKPLGGTRTALLTEWNFECHIDVSEYRNRIVW